MRQRLMTRRGRGFVALASGIAFMGWIAWQGWPGDVQAEASLASSSQSEELAEGRELFHRSWLPEDPRSPNGDGLGPMFNETSCVACHNQGGPGGGGPTSKNVLLLTAFIAQPQVRFNVPTTGPVPSGFRGGGFPGGASQPQATIDPAALRKAIVQQLVKIHPEFEKSSSVVLHRFGTASRHDQWRRNVLLGVPQSFQTTQMGGRGTHFVQATFHSPPAASTPGTEPAPAELSPTPAEPPRADAPGEVAATTQLPQAGPAPPSVQPAQPVPINTTFENPIQQVLLNNFSQASVATGIPLVDEAITQMRVRQQEARQDLSGVHNQGHVILQRSQRNTSALFGVGMIDAISDEIIEATAKVKYEDFPRVSGRVHRLEDGLIGKFGWKAQKATLREFTLSACANELGLDVPGHAQPVAPYEADKKTKGHDMTEDEADALVAYVRSLPAPIQEVPDNKLAAQLIGEGKAVFESVGCAVCHKENLGEAKGIYSDLLLHDMGEQLQASGSYGSSFTPAEFDPSQVPEITDAAGQPGETNSAEAQQPAQAAKMKKAAPAASGEWRTPPLWGLRDSAPYLHDGRAESLDQAIALHGGEGSDAAIRFFMLPAKKQQQMIAFLKTLRAPVQHAAK